VCLHESAPFAEGNEPQSQLQKLKEDIMTSLYKYNASQRKSGITALLFVFMFLAFSLNALAGTSLTLSSITPATGSLSGGNVVTLNGTGFTTNTSVWIWANQAPVAKYVSATQLTVTVPAKSSAGAVDVVVVNSGVQYRLSNGYTYSTATTSAQLSLSTTSISFANTAVGSSSTQTLTLKSSGTAPVTVSAGSVTGTGFTSTGAAFPLSLAPGQQTAFQVKFAPASAGTVSGKISLTSNAASSPTATVALAGTGMAPVAQLSLSSTSMTFASTAVGSSATQTLTLTDSGTGPLTVSAGSITGAGFSATGVTFPLSLTPGQQTTFQVKFAPTSAGTVSGKISLTSNSVSSSTSTVTLAGTGAATGTALSECGDITTSGSYVLAVNVSSQSTCFFIDANNVTLNLNGHTITYGTVSGPLPTPGIVLADNWFNGLQMSGSTGNHGGFVLLGPGTLQDGPADATVHNAGIWVGESSGVSPAPIVHDVTITTNGPKANTIYATGSVSGWQIYNNTLSMNNSVALPLSDRSAFLGQAILLSDPEQAAGVIPDLIYNNHILAATQGGIRTTHQNARIYNNDITFNSRTSNDFCVDVPADAQQVYQNNCHPVSGRGIHMNAASLDVHDNTINVIELKQNVEYNGCELGGTYGMQLEFDVFQGIPPTGTTIANNTVTATAGDCDGIGMRMTGLTTSGSAAYTRNIVTTSNKNGTGHDFALSFDQVQEGSNMVIYTANTFQSQYAYLTVAWDGASLVMPVGQTWKGTPTYVVDDQNGFNDPKDGGPTFTQSITIDDQLANKVNCGNYAAGVVSIGGVNSQCNQ
jgi:hypothetical protein